MKKSLLLLTILFVITSKLLSQNQWDVLNPKPSGYSGIDIHFVTNDKGFIVNNYEVLITTDCGENWVKLKEISSSNDINFYNSVGFIVGNYGYVLKTINNGMDWNSINIGTTENLNTVNLISEDTIIVSSGKKIFKSFDGGNNWEIVNIINYTANRTFFLNSKVGHAACNSGKIIKTINGGLNWYVTESVNTTPSDFFTIYFINNEVGFASREHNDILKTTDGGESWIEITNTSDAIYSFYFFDELNGYISGEFGVIFRTTDGGNSWDWAGFQSGRIDETTINSIHFVDNSIGFAVGIKGRILKTVDGGASWNTYSPYYYDISDMSFPSNKVGYCTAGYNLLKTTNGGDDWDLIPTGLSGGLTSIDFIDDSIGYGLLGSSVYKTLNGGKTWTIKNVGNLLFNENLYSLDFINSDTGYVSGGYNYTGSILTIDGGESWEKIGSIAFGEIQFLNSQVGYARNTGNYYRRIYKTINGGLSWSIVFELTDDINSFHFINENVGYLVGEYGICYKTIDGGLTWQELDPEYIDYKVVKFYDQNIGYISGESNYKIHIFKTINGGETWIEENIPNVSASIGLTSISITENRKILISGANGIILRDSISTNSQTSIKPSNDLNNPEIKLYPNPSSEFLYILGIENYPIMIEVIDINGKSINTKFINNSLLDISYLNNGIYIFKIFNKNNIYIKKIVKN